MEEEKVYCSDCRYYKKKTHIYLYPKPEISASGRVEIKPPDHFCVHPRYVQKNINDTPIKRVKRKRYGSCKVINMDNDCKEFQSNRTGLIILIVLVVLLIILIGVML